MRLAEPHGVHGSTVQLQQVGRLRTVRLMVQRKEEGYIDFNDVF